VVMDLVTRLITLAVVAVEHLNREVQPQHQQVLMAGMAQHRQFLALP